MGGKGSGVKCRWETPVSDNINGKTVVRKEYTQWLGMFNRAKGKKNYENVVLSEMFKSYDLWYDWAREQKGFMELDVKDRIWALDKDIVGDGTIYSEDVCVFVPCVINNLFRSVKKKSTGYAGVFKESRKKLFKAGITVESKSHHLGYFKTEVEAHLEYLKYRKMFADKLYTKYGDTVDDRVWDSLFKSCEYSDIPDISRNLN